MKKTLVCLSVAVLLLFGVIQAVSAAGMEWDGGRQMKNNSMKFNLPEKLNLTEQQITKIKEVAQKNYEQTRGLRIKLMDSRQELKQLKLQKNPDQAQIDAKTKEITDLQKQLHDIMQQNKEQCLSLLTKEQREQIKQLHGNCRGFAGGSGAAKQ
ncbi:MAG: Spy/CpxP family protein refolding chaperone [Firmicutes bacterium]|nr:Spy/CpxP family protein refolding chaperone [Bacillota bacterium]